MVKVVALLMFIGIHTVLIAEREILPRRATQDRATQDRNTLNTIAHVTILNVNATSVKEFSGGTNMALCYGN